MCVCAVFKIQEFVCKHFLPSLHSPSTPSFNLSIYRPVILYSRTAQKCFYAGYLWLGQLAFRTKETYIPLSLSLGIHNFRKMAFLERRNTYCSLFHLGLLYIAKRATRQHAYRTKENEGNIYSSALPFCSGNML